MLVDGMPYYHKLYYIMVGPIAVSVAVSLVVIAWEMYQGNKRHQSLLALKRTAAGMETDDRRRSEVLKGGGLELAMDGSAEGERVHAHMWKKHFKHGLDQAAFLVCMLLDTIYPTVTRT